MIVTPVTSIVPGAGVCVEEAVRLARRVVLPGDAAEEAVLGVVAGPKALIVCGVDFAVTVVVEAIATLVDLPLAGAHLAVAGARELAKRLTHFAAKSFCSR